MTEADKLADLALTPDVYGDSVQITHVPGGGMLLIPLVGDEEQGERQIVLDREQVSKLAIHLNPEAKAEAARAARLMFNEWADKDRPSCSIALLTGAALGILLQWFWAWVL